MYLGVWISLDNDAWEKLLLLFVFCWQISIRINMMVCCSMWERSPLLPKKKVCVSLSRHNLTSWTPGDLCQPGGSLMWHLEENTVNAEEASDRDTQTSTLFHRVPDTLRRSDALSLQWNTGWRHPNRDGSPSQHKGTHVLLVWLKVL